MSIQVLAFMKPYFCEVSREIIFYQLYAAMIQIDKENGILIEEGRITKMERPLEQKKIDDVVDIFEKHEAANLPIYESDLVNHPFCMRGHGRTGVNKFIYVSDNLSKPKNLADIWLRHWLVSMCITKNNFWNLDGQFSKLPNIAWIANKKMVLAEHANEYFFKKSDTPYSVDKFPKLTDWWIPENVRIADSHRVRLGAFVGSGVTVMHEGFLNFNAAVIGPGMIEGRVSAGVIIGPNSDLGGGCSTMGTLSGGGKEKISVGLGCLIGAEAGIGISLGDNCTIEAGLYITAGTKIFVLEENVVVKASSLSGKSNLLFIRNSQSGRVEVFNKVNENKLNLELHDNN